MAEDLKKKDSEQLNEEQLDNVAGALRKEDVIRKYLFPKDDSDAAK